MSDISLENQLLRAVDIVVTGELDQLELDKTILAVVEEKPLNRLTGEHTVRYQDSSFKAYSTNPNLYYEPGTMVYVQIPKNDFSEKKIITGGKSTVPGDILASNLFYGDTTTINGGNIQTGTIDAGAITLGARNVSLTGRFTANYSTATTPLNGHLWYEGGEIIIPGSSWAEAQMIGPFTVVSGDKCVSPLADTVYWIYAEISGSTLNDIFIPNPSLPALIKTGTSIPEDTEESIKIKVGIWQTDSVKKGVLALSIGQTYINGNEIITGTVIADYMRVGGGATQIGVDEFYNESKSLILTASSPIYSFDSFDTLTPSNQSITFTANLQHLDIDDLEFTIQAYDSEGTLISSATPSLDINDNQAILNASELSSDYFSIKVTVTAEGYSDFITINKVKDGADGASGTRTAIIELYKWSESVPTDFPSGQVVYAWETGKISTLPITDNDWALTPPSSAPEGQILWGCRTIYTDQGNSPTSTVNFSTEVAYPIGRAGSSGKGYEFIYYLSNSTAAPNTPSAVSDQGWSANPSSVTKDNRYLYASFRTSNEGIWGDYSAPVLWAKYGTDGTGVSYIYTRTTTKTTAPDTPAGNGGQTGIPEDWTDEPKGVDATNRYEWISVSHYTNEEWKPYSPPSLYNEFTASSFLITLTNENHPFTCDSEGNPISGNYADGATTINVLYGTEYLTFQAGSEDPTEEKRFIINYNAVGVSLTPSASFINSSTFTPQDMTANSATVTFTIRALINGEIISGTKVMSYSKQITGASGTPSYFHIAYSNSADGDPIRQDEGTYVGTYVDDNLDDSDNPEDYTWRLWKGADGTDGTNGIPGKDGANGQSSYLHLKYSNDGGSSFTSNSGEDPGAWLGQYVDNVLQDSTSPGRYTWKKIEGEVGDQGPQGNQGTPGPPGSIGPVGPTGPGILFRGAYSSSEPYYANADRRDVVSYNSNYYIRKPYGSGSLGKLPSNTSYWAQMASFASVATDFLLAQDAQITKVLNIGINSMNSSANITLNGGTEDPYFSLGQTALYQQYDKSGIFIGKESNSYKFSLVSSDNAKKLLWDGTNFSIIGGAIEGGDITGATITGSTMQTAEPGTARVVLSGTVSDEVSGYCWVNFETEDYEGFVRGAARIAGTSEVLEPQVAAGQLYLSSPQYNGSPIASVTLSSGSGGLAYSDIQLNSAGGGVTVYPKSTNDYLNSAFIGTDANYHTVLKLGNAIYPGKPSGASGGGVTLKGLNASKVLQVRNYNDSLYGDVHADTLVALTNLRTDSYLQMKEQGGTNSVRDMYLWTDGTTWQLRFYVGATLKRLTFV